MRILHACFTRALNGSEHYCVDLANRQAAMGEDVHVVMAPKSPMAQKLSAGVTIHHWGAITRAFFARRALGKISPDAIHCHLSVACKLFCKIKGKIRTIATLHVGYKPRQHDGLNGLITLFPGDTAAVMAAGKSANEIWNWAPTAPDISPDARANTRAEMGADNDCFVVGTIGRLHPTKDSLGLIAAFKAANVSNSQLWLAGTGPLLAQVTARAAHDSRIKQLGYRHDGAALLMGMDLFCLPSFEERFSLALLEAARSGVAIAASKVGAAEVFLANSPAQIFDAGDHRALTTSILKAAADFRAKGPVRITYDLSGVEPSTQVQKIIVYYTNA